MSGMGVIRRGAWVALAVLAACVVAACGGSGQGGSKAASTGDPALDKLVAAAKKEGQVTFYSVPAEEEAQRVVDAFSQKYGIRTNFQRLVSAQLQQRFSAEAQAGAPGADAIIVSRSPFVVDAEKKGWLIGPGKAGIPGYPPAGLPKKFVQPEMSTAIIQLTPSAIAFNTDAVPATQAPKDWPALLNPRYKGKILMPDPSSSPAYIDFWYRIEKQYGIGYLRKLRGQVSRMFPSTVPMTEALAAGEGAIGVPAVPVVVTGLKGHGAPLDFAIPAATTGPEEIVGIAAKAKHPNAARLFAHFMLSAEGSKALSGNDPGTVSPYDTKRLPSGYESIDHAEAVKHQAEIYSAFGVK